MVGSAVLVAVAGVSRSRGLDVEGFLLGLALWLAALVWWPLWFLAKWCGVRWKIVVRHEGQMVRTEKVRGWDTSQHRIEEIALSLRAGVVAHRLISPDAQVANPQR